MKVLILGGSGMLGHKLWQKLASRFDTYVTFRGAVATYGPAKLFDPARSLGNVSVQDARSVEDALAATRPEVVINCIGIIKQDPAAKDPITSIEVNALFPHRVAKACAATGTRLVQVSTDCVFSGRKGNYKERDVADAEDLYGRTKVLGEVNGNRCLTIRTSMIGRELRGARGLLEWFLSQKGRRVRGFTHAVFSGFTTPALADAIATVIANYPELEGIWHMASEPISKFDLLRLVKQTYGLEVQIEPDESVVCDRSLDSSHFRNATGIQSPSWPEMIENMRVDSTPYDQIRGTEDPEG